MTPITTDPQSLQTVTALQHAAALHLDPMIPGAFERRHRPSHPQLPHPPFVKLIDRASCEHEREGGGAPSSRTRRPASWLTTWLRRP